MMRVNALPLLTVLVLLAGGTLPGCQVGLGPSKDREPLRWYRIVGEPASPPGGRVAGSVAFRPFSQDAALDADGIHYLETEVMGGYWATQRWVMPVAEMVRQFLLRDLEAAEIFDRVLLLDNSGYAEYVVSGLVNRFEEVDRADGWYVVAEVMVEANRVDGNEITFHRRFRAEEKCAEDTVPEVVRALGRAMDRIALDVRRELLDAFGDESR